MPGLTATGIYKKFGMQAVGTPWQQVRSGFYKNGKAIIAIKAYADHSGYRYY